MHGVVSVAMQLLLAHHTTAFGDDSEKKELRKQGKKILEDCLKLRKPRINKCDVKAIKSMNKRAGKRINIVLNGKLLVTQLYVSTVHLTCSSEHKHVKHERCTHLSN